MLQENRNFLSPLPLSQCVLIQFLADSLSWLPPLLLTSSLTSAHILKGGFRTDEETAFKPYTAGVLSYSPTVQSGNRGALLWRCILMSCWRRCWSVCLHRRFLSPPPLLPFPKPPFLPVSPPTPLSPPSVSQFCSKRGWGTFLLCEAFC